MTQSSRPTPPTGYVWNTAPADANTVTVSTFSLVLIGGEIPSQVRSVPASFTNTLVPTFTVSGTASPLAGGTVTCTPTTVNSGSTSTCTATTNAGYTYTGMSGCGGTPTAATTYTTGPVTANCTVTGTYTLNTFTVTGVASPLAGGTVACAPTTVNFNATSPCTATTNAGYTYTGMSGCRGTATAATTYTTGPVTATCTVTGTYTFNSYAITTVVTPAGSGTLVCVPNPVTHGATATCTASPNPGYLIAPLSVSSANGKPTTSAITTSSISGCGGTPTATSPYTTGVVTAPCTVTAAFVLQTFTVTGVASPLAGGNVACMSPVNFNTTSSCTATANAGYTFTGMSGCGGTASASSPYTTGAVTANCSVTGTFTLNGYPITTVASPASGGSVSCLPNPANFGATSTCTATANTGYALTTISGCGGTPSATSPYTTGAISSACTVTATFQSLTFPITTLVVVAGGGTLNCTPSPVPSGSTSTCTAAANAGFLLSSISGCGGLAKTTSPFTTGPVTAACTVTAIFAVQVAPAVGVPTLAQWALALLTLLLASLGGVVYRRRVG